MLQHGGCNLRKCEVVMQSTDKRDAGRQTRGGEEREIQLRQAGEAGDCGEADRSREVACPAPV